ncbi:AMP-binding protein [Streptomyces sp. NPDC090075]|uniref:AMP-binding protein n=1 Tax=Streptomyces sp. NPDC090075 TaxID=3365937 RepID=UPI003822F4BE
MHTTPSPGAPFPDSVARADPARPAFVMAETGHMVTYGELVDSSRAIAALLWSRGLRHGDCVAILMENTADYLPVAWAAQRCGLRYVGLPVRLEPAEAAYILRDSQARALVTSPAHVDRAAAALLEAPGVELRFSTGPAAQGFEELAEAASAALPVVPEEREGVDLLYSSGTTGRPKGVAANLPLAPLGTPPGVATLLHERWGLDEKATYLSPAPLYHAAPLRFCMTVHRYGGTVVIMERFGAEAALELIERHRVTHTQMVPTMLTRMLKLPAEARARRDLSSLRVLVHAAAPCPPEAKRALIAWLGPIVHEYYSSTENYLFTAIDSQEWLAHPGSVGRPLLGRPHILDEVGGELPVGEIGTVWSEGGLPFEYLNDPAKTAESRNDRGWTTVGDLGHLDADGYLYLADRRVDLVLSGGVNIYPQEAENVLVAHADVADAAVFGIPHDELGEVVHAVVQLRPDLAPSPEMAEQLIDWCRRHLSAYKCPRGLDFADELPRSPTGKLFKRELREQYR